MQKLLFGTPVYRGPQLQNISKYQDDLWFAKRSISRRKKALDLLDKEYAQKSQKLARKKQLLENAYLLNPSNELIGELASIHKALDDLRGDYLMERDTAQFLLEFDQQAQRKARRNLVFGE